MTVSEALRILVGPERDRSGDARQREVETVPSARTPKSHPERAKPPDTVEPLPARGVALSKAPRKIDAATRKELTER